MIEPTMSFRSVAELNSMTANSTLRLMAVDAKLLVRDALAHRLSAEPDLEVVAVAMDAEEALDRVRAQDPDILIMEVSVPGLSVFDGVRRIQEAGFTPRVILVSDHFHDHHLTEGLAVGARAFVLKDEPLTGLLNAIQAVASGATYLSQGLEGRLQRKTTGELMLRPVKRLLSPREMQVLRYLADGHSKKDVAGMMEISVKTVEGHAQHLMKKLDIHNRVELAHYAIREGIVHP